MEERTLIFNSWLTANMDLLALSETVASFLVNNTQWRAPLGNDRYVKVQEEYYLASTWSLDNTPPGGQPLDYRKGGNVLARQQIREREVGKIQINFPAYWRNPYVVNQPVYQSYGVGIGIFVEQDNSESTSFSVMIAMYDSNLWFPPPKYAETIYDSYGFVGQYQAQGYELNKGEAFYKFDGQSYVVESKLSQMNRLKVITGITQYIHRFSPEAAILTYHLQADYSRRNQEISYEKASEYPAPMYYLSHSASIKPQSLRNFEVSYFAQNINGIQLHLEEDHFGFLKEEGK